MNKEVRKINTFTDLIVWQKSHIFVVKIYKITKVFPRDEMLGLVSQMRRCAVSITSNIAEGFSRQSYKEKIQFYYIAQGSLTEIQNQLLISRDVDYLDNKIFNNFAEQTIEIHKLLNGLIKKSKDFACCRNS